MQRPPYPPTVAAIDLYPGGASLRVTFQNVTLGELRSGSVFNGGSFITRVAATCGPAGGGQPLWGEVASVPPGATFARFEAVGLRPGALLVCSALVSNEVGWSDPGSTGPFNASSAATPAAPLPSLPAPPSLEKLQLNVTLLPGSSILSRRIPIPKLAGSPSGGMALEQSTGHLVATGIYLIGYATATIGTNFDGSAVLAVGRPATFNPATGVWNEFGRGACEVGLSRAERLFDDVGASPSHRFFVAHAGTDASKYLHWDGADRCIEVTPSEIVFRRRVGSVSASFAGRFYTAGGAFVDAGGISRPTASLVVYNPTAAVNSRWRAIVPHNERDAFPSGYGGIFDARFYYYIPVQDRQGAHALYSADLNVFISEWKTLDVTSSIPPRRLNGASWTCGPLLFLVRGEARPAELLPGGGYSSELDHTIVVANLTEVPVAFSMVATGVPGGRFAQAAKLRGRCGAYVAGSAKSGNTTDETEAERWAVLKIETNRDPLGQQLPWPEPITPATPSPSASPSASPTPSPSASPTPSASPSPSPSPSPSLSATASPSPTAMAYPSPSASPSPTASATASATPSASPTAPPTPSASATPSASPSPCPSPLPSPTASATPLAVPSPTASPSALPSPTPPLASPTPTVDAAPTLEPFALAMSLSRVTVGGVTVSARRVKASDAVVRMVLPRPLLAALPEGEWVTIGAAGDAFGPLAGDPVRVVLVAPDGAALEAPEAHVAPEGIRFRMPAVGAARRALAQAQVARAFSLRIESRRGTFPPVVLVDALGSRGSASAGGGGGAGQQSGGTDPSSSQGALVQTGELEATFVTRGVPSEEAAERSGNLQAAGGALVQTGELEATFVTRGVPSEEAAERSGMGGAGSLNSPSWTDDKLVFAGLVSSLTLLATVVVGVASLFLLRHGWRNNQRRPDSRSDRDRDPDLNKQKAGKV
eukprot:tig00020912_g15871.t1